MADNLIYLTIRTFGLLLYLWLFKKVMKINFIIIYFVILFIGCESSPQLVLTDSPIILVSKNSKDEYRYFERGELGVYLVKDKEYIPLKIQTLPFPKKNYMFFPESKKIFINRNNNAKLGNVQFTLLDISNKENSIKDYMISSLTGGLKECYFMNDSTIVFMNQNTIYTYDLLNEKLTKGYSLTNEKMLYSMLYDNFNHRIYTVYVNIALKEMTLKNSVIDLNTGQKKDLDLGATEFYDINDEGKIIYWNEGIKIYDSKNDTIIVPNENLLNNINLNILFFNNIQVLSSMKVDNEWKYYLYNLKDDSQSELFNSNIEYVILDIWNNE